MTSFIWIAVVAGFLSLLTPCVFPMIPITVSYFGGRANRGRAAALSEAALFAIAIIATFTALGLGLALLVGASGLARLAANPWVNIAIGISFVVFALNLMGLWELDIPFLSRTATSADTALRNRQAGPAAALLMGFGFTLASFTCTAPFVGPLLVSAARGEWHRPLIGMLAFSIVFAVPFFVFAVIPAMMERLPRPGHWMVTLRFLVGIAELGASVKFFSNADLVWRTHVISREAIVATWAALALGGAIYLLIPLFRASKSFSPQRALVTIACAAIAFFIGRGLAGKSLGELEAFLPPQDITGEGATNVVESRANADWILNNQPAALARAKQTGKLVLIDFTGYTCTNCRWMESNIFSRADVANALRGYVLSRLYTDGQGKLYEDQQDFQERQFGTVALPLYAIVDAEGRTVRTFAGLTRSPAEFLAFLGRVS
ncbi:MAG TPA: cytochrome c biogenesis protein CcdA [Gemmatimonadaceae bacterium]|nr:cytochrome c biogenesis protein CcdA [Gemmatimonadaceae bacterium]